MDDGCTVNVYDLNSRVKLEISAAALYTTSWAYNDTVMVLFAGSCTA